MVTEVRKKKINDIERGEPKEHVFIIIIIFNNSSCVNVFCTQGLHLNEWGQDSGVEPNSRCYIWMNVILNSGDYKGAVTQFRTIINKT